jgi:CelD/BcsL family acetyltransferase involved in cellulose biosynthesis
VLQGGRRDDQQLRGLGRALFLHGVETAIARGAVCVDLLRGHDEWKETVATSSRELVAVRASSGRAAEFGHRIVGRVEYEIWRRRHANRHHDRTSRPTGMEA